MFMAYGTVDKREGGIKEERVSFFSGMREMHVSGVTSCFIMINSSSVFIILVKA